MSAQILHNSAALHALKRHQLVSLSKRYGLKASGKNVEMIERLQAHALTLSSETDFHIPEPEPTPMPSRTFTLIQTDESTPTAPRTLLIPSQDSDVIPEGSPTPTKNRSFTLPDSLGPQLNNKASIISTVSASWSILSESDASIMELVSGEHGVAAQREGEGGSVRGWKSAGNGEALTDFGIPGERPDFNSASSRSRSAGSRNSLFALASSITRSGSRHLRSRSSAAPSAYTTASTETYDNRPVTPTPAMNPSADDAEGEVIAPTAPSPASTVGIPRRHSKVTLLERPSTLRLCSPTPQTPGKVSFAASSIGHGMNLDEDDKLPFVSSASKMQMIKLKDRRSMTPGRYSSTTSRDSRKSKSSLTSSKKDRKGRKSMPATVHFASSASTSAGQGLSFGSRVQLLGNATPASEAVPPFMASSIYPPLPAPTFVSVPIFTPDEDAPPVPPMPMPGTWLQSAPATSIAGSTTLASTTPAKAPSAEVFAFGTDSPGVSTAQFTSAAQKILEQMNAKLPEGQRIGEELLKKRTVSGTSEQSDVGRKVGGWGLSGRGKDRFAAAHEKEFAKMQSIGDKPRFGKKAKSHAPLPSASGSSKLKAMTPGKKRKLSGGKSETTLVNQLDTSADTASMPSAPNGEPMTKRKRTRLSQGPRAMMGSLRVAGRSMMNLLDGGEVETARTPARKKGGLKQRLSLLRPFKRAAVADDRRLSSQGIREMAARERQRSNRGSRQAALADSLFGPTEAARVAERSTDVGNATKSQPNAPKSRLPSAMSTQTAQTGRTASSTRRNLPTRSPIPDFGQSRNQPTVNRAASSSKSVISPSYAQSSIDKRKSQALMIRTARPAPPPPSAFSYRSISGVMPAGTAAPAPSATKIAPTPSAATKRSNTLMQPTAASLARMQATVRPSATSSNLSGMSSAPTPAQTAGRPLPRPPSTMFKPAAIATSNPFGKGESRENLFDTTFNAAPAPRPLPTIPSMSPIRMPDAPSIFPSLPTAPLGERALPNGPGLTNGNIPFPFTYKGVPDTSAAKLPPRTPKGTPGKRGAYAGHTTSSAARARTQSIKHKTSISTGLAGGARVMRGAGGGTLTGVKSRGEMKGEVDAQRRRAEIRGRVGRRAEERELREMLGGMGGDVKMED